MDYPIHVRRNPRDGYPCHSVLLDVTLLLRISLINTNITNISAGSIPRKDRSLERSIEKAQCDREARNTKWSVQNVKDGSEGGGKLDLSLVEPVDLSLERHIGHLDLEDARDEFGPASLQRSQLCSQPRLSPKRSFNMAARERRSGSRTWKFFRSLFTSVVKFFSSSSACSMFLAVASFR